MKEKILKFPQDFLWGTATSAHQVEGDNVNSDWWVWEKQNKGKILEVEEEKFRGKKFEPSGKACDHYHKYEEDFDLIQKMHNNAYRLSIEWSRIEPKEGKWNYEEIKHYHDVLLSLKKRNIKVMLTLHHFTNPSWFAQKGGWEKRQSVKYFTHYVKFITEELGELVDFWITINEPGAYIDGGYFRAYWPPQKKSFFLGVKVFLNMACAHRKAYKIIHQVMKEKYPDKEVKVGMAMNVISFTTYYKHRLIEQFYVYLADKFLNHSFYILSGVKNHDFLGINYYFRVRLRRKRKSLLPEQEEMTIEERETSDMGWLIFPHGIYGVLINFSTYNLPIYITENGIAAEDDTRRVRFLLSHLEKIYYAIKAGVKVKGYFHWSLLDNFEWDKGFWPKFGLVGVDFRTQKRSLKESGKVYGEICQLNGIPIYRHDS